jgi:hypothetical protein
MSLNEDDYIKFPINFNAHHIHKLMNKTDKSLAEQRRMIIFQIKHNLHNFKNNYPTSNRMAQCDVHGSNYKNLSIIHKELIERGFNIEYQTYTQNDDVIISKIISYEEIDPNGPMPDKLVIRLPATTHQEPNDS